MKKRVNSRVVIKFFLVSVVSVLIVFAFVFGIGLLNIHNFQKKAIQQGKERLTEYFAQRGEHVTEFISPDYSIVPSSGSLVAIIEIGIITETSSYYAVLRVANSWWVTNSILNVVMTPKIEIISVDQDQRVREKSGM